MSSRNMENTCLLLLKRKNVLTAPTESLLHLLSPCPLPQTDPLLFHCHRTGTVAGVVHWSPVPGGGAGLPPAPSYSSPRQVMSGADSKRSGGVAGWEGLSSRICCFYCCLPPSCHHSKLHCSAFYSPDQCSLQGCEIRKGRTSHFTYGA